MTERGRIPALAFEGDERPRFALRDPEPLVNVARGRPEEHQRVERPVDDDAEQATQLPVDLWFLGMSFPAIAEDVCGIAGDDPSGRVFDSRREQGACERCRGGAA